MESDNVLEIKNLNVAVGDREILHDINLSIKTGETHVLFGPNGSGKTTLIMAIMGSPKYQVTKGSIIFRGRDIVGLPVDERARLGIGISLQRPPVVRGVKTRDMVTACAKGRVSAEIIDSLAERANLTELMDREVNYGFSGGEIKRSELLQLLAQDPALALLDEPESGVDLVNIALIGELINELLQKEHPIRDRRHAGLIITHTGHILDYVNSRSGYVLLGGRIVCEGDPREVLETVKRKGYEECKRCVA
ncbi:MAG: ABC transporter ATP-binding protein [Chloroflexi bacterium RBG_13_50_10]|nr:MAG: ABC transporter ATP-binding protein [Chloroflexi bacterium RBG_13_50_10]